MSYNGVGLSTVRGSGTNGYVQKNFASVRKRRKQPRYDEQKSRAALESRLHRPPNKELLEHDRKREIELKCAEMEDKMEEQGYPEDEIEEQISVLRATLLEQYNKDLAKRNARYLLSWCSCTHTRCLLIPNHTHAHELPLTPHRCAVTPRDTEQQQHTRKGATPR